MAKKILLVDDSQTVRSICKDDLEAAGYDCLAVESVQAGIEALEREERFDLIISDYNMPEKNGLEFLYYVRCNIRYDHVPFVLISAEGIVSDDDPTSLEKVCQEGYAIFRSKVGLVCSELAEELLRRKT